MSPIFELAWNFGNFNASSENFRTFAADKDRGLEYIRKSLNMAPPLLYRYHDASDFTALKSSRDLGEKRELTCGSIHLSMRI